MLWRAAAETQVGEAICTHPDIRMVSFTGSTATGQRIAQLCSPLIKRVTLELGGKVAVGPAWTPLPMRSPLPLFGVLASFLALPKPFVRDTSSQQPPYHLSYTTGPFCGV